MAYHDEYLELISAAIDGALSPAELERLNAHLAQCPECKALYRELSALHTALSDLPPVEVPAGLHDRVMKAVAAEQVLPFAPAEKKKAPVHWQRWLASAAVLALVLMGAWSWKPWEAHSSNDWKTQSAQPQQPASGGIAGTTADLPQASMAPEAAAPKAAAASDSDSTDLPAPLSETLPAPANALPCPAEAPVEGENAEAARIGDEIAAKSKELESLIDDALTETGDGSAQLQSVSPTALEPEAQAPALFSAASLPLPAQVPEETIPAAPEETIPAAPEETLSPVVRSFMAPANGAEESAEPVEITVQNALERLVAYIFEYSGYDSVEYISEEEGLYAQVTAQGCGGNIYFLPEKEDETLYWFEFHPEMGDDVYYYTVCRLTGEPTSLLGE